MIRLRSLALTNFKNVRHGEIKLSEAMCLEDVGVGADVVGIYGQNGSGKTSFIQALYIIKQLMGGEALPSSVREYISSGADAITLALEFLLVPGDDRKIVDYLTGVSVDKPSTEEFIVDYRVTIGSCCGRSPLVISESLRCKNVSIGENYHEIVSWSVENDAEEKSKPKSPVSGFSSVIPSWISNPSGDWNYELSVLSPISHWHTVKSVNDSFETRMEVARRKALEEGRSLLFSEDFLRLAVTTIGAAKERESRAVLEATVRVLLPAILICSASHVYATRNMAVLTTSHQGMLALSYLPLASHEGERGEYNDNFLLLDIEKTGRLTPKHLDELERSLERINIVIDAVIPGLQIGVVRLGERAGKDGEVVEEFELMARRGDSSTPLRNESEGIKKILSIVSLLVDVHVNPLTFLAIDELDSGVFEYLLGEVLSAIADNGMGQLVFTAHNLRPLEVLKSKSIWFTKTDENDRYVVSKGVRGSNNLRRMYLRNIRLGGENGDIYLPTNPLEIDSALYEVGMALRNLQMQQGVGDSSAE